MQNVFKQIPILKKSEKMFGFTMVFFTFLILVGIIDLSLIFIFQHDGKY